MDSPRDVRILNSTQASRSTFFSQFTLSVIAASCVLSVSRIMAHWKYYHAPMSVTHALEAAEVPRLLNVTGLISLPPPSTTAGRSQRHSDEDQLPRIDLGLIQDWDLRLCVGKEWYRFPGHFLVPDGVRVDWIKSEFDGMLPGHFAETARRGGLLERAGGTRAVPKYLNDLNAEAPQLYVSAGFVGCSEAGGVVADSICFLFSPLPPSIMARAAGREGGRGGVRLPARPRLPPSPDGGGARAAVHRGREDVGAGDVPAIPGRSALAAADAHALDAGRAVAAEQRVWGVLPAETPGERGEKGEGAHGRGPGVTRSVAGARTVSKARAAELHGYLFYVERAVMLIPVYPAESRVRTRWRPV